MSCAACSSESEKKTVESVIVLRSGAWFRLRSDQAQFSPDGTKLVFFLEGKPIAVFARDEMAAAADNPIDFQAPLGPRLQ